MTILHLQNPFLFVGKLRLKEILQIFQPNTLANKKKKVHEHNLITAEITNGAKNPFIEETDRQKMMTLRSMQQISQVELRVEQNVC